MSLSSNCSANSPPPPADRSSSPAASRATSDADLSAIYAPASGTNIRIGTLYQDMTRPAFLLMDQLLTRHFAVLGSTGSGKSCTATLVLSAIIEEHPGAHIVLLDPHNEYATAFGELAEVINVDTLQMPFWFFDSRRRCGSWCAAAPRRSRRPRRSS